MLLSYPIDLFKKLEFDKIIELVASHCVSSLGKATTYEMQVHSELYVIKQLLNETEEFRLLLQQGNNFPTSSYLDLSQEISYLRIENSILDEEKFHRLQLFLITVRHIYVWLNQHLEEYPALHSLLNNMPFEKKIIHEIQLILEDTGGMRSNASKELTNCRVQITKYRKLIDNKFREIIKGYNREGWLADEIESVRNDRLVLCVFAENKRKIKGIIHDESATGKTVFIEPIEIVELSNDYFSFKIAEQREIARILKVLTNVTRPYVDTLIGYQQLIAKIDHTRAKALFALSLDASLPIIRQERKSNYVEAYHPLLKLINQKNGKKIVPLNFELNDKNRMLLLSGPNAGGKTICLKTVGLTQLMVQSGLLVCLAAQSQLMIFKQIIVELGDEQSIENQLSTYSSKLKNMRYVVDNMDKDTLVLMDEMGTGTDPSLGGAIAESVMEEMLKKNCFAVLNTHYSNLKLFASEKIGFINGAMLFDMSTLQPLYQLQLGKAGSSYTFEMAQINGLQRHIIDRAKSKTKVEERQYDQVLAQLQAERKEVTQLQNTLTQKVDSYKRRLIHLDAEEKRLEEKKKDQRTREKQQVYDLLTKEEKRFQQLYQEYSKQLVTKESYLELFKKIKFEKEKVSEQNTTTTENNKQVFVETFGLKKGDWVKIIDTDAVGEVVEIRNKMAAVQFENMKTQVPQTQLQQVTKHNKIKKNTIQTSAVKNLIEKRSEFNNDLDVRGMTQIECAEILTPFIDTALMVMQYKIKIIHGKGTGSLRNYIRQQLSKHKNVKTFYSELDSQGGDGVTLIELQ